MNFASRIRFIWRGRRLLPEIPASQQPDPTQVSPKLWGEDGVRLLCRPTQHLFWRSHELPIRLSPVMQNLLRPTESRLHTRRRGASSLDYVLILATMLPIVAFIITKGKKMMALVWEMLCVQVSWPFL